MPGMLGIVDRSISKASIMNSWTSALSAQRTGNSVMWRRSSQTLYRVSEVSSSSISQRSRTASRVRGQPSVLRANAFRSHGEGCPERRYSTRATVRTSASLSRHCSKTGLLCFGSGVSDDHRGWIRSRGRGRVLGYFLASRDRRSYSSSHGSMSRSSSSSWRSGAQFSSQPTT
jgi:hypothetical protein